MISATGSIIAVFFLALVGWFAGPVGVIFGLATLLAFSLRFAAYLGLFALPVAVRKLTTLTIVVSLVLIAIIGGVDVISKQIAKYQETNGAKETQTIIWRKWGEVTLTDKWSNYLDTKAVRDRIVPPPGGVVEVLYENGAYRYLSGDPSLVSNDQYIVIEIKVAGKFRLKGTPGKKATIYVGKKMKMT